MEEESEQIIRSQNEHIHPHLAYTWGNQQRLQEKGVTVEVKEEGQGRRHLTTVGEAADILDLSQGHTHLVEKKEIGGKVVRKFED